MGTISMFYKVMESGDQKRWATMQEAAGVEVQQGIAYMEDGHPMHTLNIYRAEGAVGKQPTIVEVHGGSWIYGDRNLNRHLDRWLALRGYTVVALSYRVCPEVNYAGGVQDLFAAFAWLAQHGAEYGCDMDNLYLCGDSSGGHLCSKVVECIAMPRRAAAYEVGPCPLHFNAVNFTCGAFYLGDMCNIAGARLYFGKIIGKGWRKNKFFDLANLDLPAGLPDVPPMILSSCYADFLRNQVQKAYKALSEAGYTVQLVYREAKTENDLEHVYNVHSPDFAESIETNQAMLDFFARYRR